MNNLNITLLALQNAIILTNMTDYYKYYIYSYMIKILFIFFFALLCLCLCVTHLYYLHSCLFYRLCV